MGGGQVECVLFRLLKETLNPFHVVFLPKGAPRTPVSSCTCYDIILRIVRLYPTAVGNQQYALPAWKVPLHCGLQRQMTSIG